MAETPAFKQEKVSETIRRLNDTNRHRQSLGSFPHLTVEGYQLQAIDLSANAIKEIKMARVRSTQTQPSIKSPKRAVVTRVEFN